MHVMNAGGNRDTETMLSQEAKRRVRRYSVNHD